MKATQSLDNLQHEIRQRAQSVEEKVSEAAQRAGRARDDIRVVAVSKRQPTTHVAAGILAGLTDLGENYVQEAQSKQASIAELLEPSDMEPVRWHLIGNLQQNKASQATRHFGVVHTLDRAKLARALDRHAESAGRNLEVLIQLNLSRETQKSGIPEEEAMELASECANLRHLELVGLMTVPAANPDPEASRPVFRRLREIRDELREKMGIESLAHLSMGMSADFHVAIEEGATLVRVGTALFGARETST